MNLYWVYKIEVYGVFAGVPMVYAGCQTEQEAMELAANLVSLGMRAYIECAQD